MEWRLANRQDWRDGAGDLNHNRMRDFVASGEVPGIIAYVDGEPAGWCSVSPRPQLIGMRDALRHPDAADIWSVICFYVPEQHRGRGMMGALLSAAVDYAKANGARIVEGYPFVPEMADDGVGGTTLIFERDGFERVAEIRPGQFTMRYYTHRRP